MEKPCGFGQGAGVFQQQQQQQQGSNSSCSDSRDRGALFERGILEQGRSSTRLEPVTAVLLENAEGTRALFAVWQQEQHLFSPKAHSPEKHSPEEEEEDAELEDFLGSSHSAADSRATADRDLSLLYHDHKSAQEPRSPCAASAADVPSGEVDIHLPTKGSSHSAADENKRRSTAIPGSERLTRTVLAFLRRGANPRPEGETPLLHSLLKSRCLSKRAQLQLLLRHSGPIVGLCSASVLAWEKNRNGRSRSAPRLERGGDLLCASSPNHRASTTNLRLQPPDEAIISSAEEEHLEHEQDPLVTTTAFEHGENGNLNSLERDGELSMPDLIRRAYEAVTTTAVELEVARQLAAPAGAATSSSGLLHQNTPVEAIQSDVHDQSSVQGLRHLPDFRVCSPVSSYYSSSPRSGIQSETNGGVGSSPGRLERDSEVEADLLVNEELTAFFGPSTSGKEQEAGSIYDPVEKPRREDLTTRVGNIKGETGHEMNAAEPDRVIDWLDDMVATAEELIAENLEALATLLSVTQPRLRSKLCHDISLRSEQSLPPEQRKKLHETLVGVCGTAVEIHMRLI
ncbi:unnamed protein product [Amoebophrya sp. A25]|nr:unnamed protein product [Amoebophrya sp. A25]|eukprot:GSA25T00019013001.1